MLNSEPVKKRSKLVLPAPQISEAELEEVCDCTKSFPRSVLKSNYFHSIILIVFLKKGEEAI